MFDPTCGPVIACPACVSIVRNCFPTNVFAAMSGRHESIAHCAFAVCCGKGRFGEGFDISLLLRVYTARLMSHHNPRESTRPRGSGTVIFAHATSVFRLPAPLPRRRCEISNFIDSCLATPTIRGTGRNRFRKLMSSQRACACQVAQSISIASPSPCAHAQVPRQLCQFPYEACVLAICPWLICIAGAFAQRGAQNDVAMKDCFADMAVESPRGRSYCGARGASSTSLFFKHGLGTHAEPCGVIMRGRSESVFAHRF